MRMARYASHRLPASSDLSPIRRRLACADLLASTERLAHYAVKGTPKHVGEGETCSIILARIVGAVSANDLPGPYGLLWESACRYWSKPAVCTLEQAACGVPLEEQETVAQVLTHVRTHGMDIALYAPVAARRVVALRQAMDRFEESQAAAAGALEEVNVILGGVVGT